MKSLRCHFQVFCTVLFILVPAFLWVISPGYVAFAAYVDSAHGDSSDGVERSGATYSAGDCAHCHDTFNSGICTGTDPDAGPNMLFAKLDNPDFCMECHTDSGSVQVGGLAGAAGDIENIFTTKTYKHNVLGYSGLHRFWYASPPAQTSSDVEDRTYLSANKHVECNDCHNPHTAESGLHSSNEFHVSVSGNDISGTPINGAFGVEPTAWGNNWSGPLIGDWEDTSSTATKEYQVCFKCHSNYNTNFASWGGSGTELWTNVALEFNPNNGSYHPVVAALPETDPGANGSNRLPPAFTSLLIGDSGFSAYTRDDRIDIDPDVGNGKRWVPNEWVNWGVRVGTLTYPADESYNQFGRVTANSDTSLTVAFNGQGMPVTYATRTVYSIEYYAGTGTRDGNIVTDTHKDFYRYLPSLAGYVVVIVDPRKNTDGTRNIAEGTVVSNTATTFTVDNWTVVYGNSVPSQWWIYELGYYFSATGQTMMCSDCHSNDEISTTAAQGPHGSAVKWMLKGRNRAWPTLSKADNGQGTGTLRQIGNDVTPNHRSVMDGNDNGNGLFCLNCHSTVSFSKNKYGLQDSSNVHLYHAHNWPEGPECVRCHIMVPHGGKLSRLIGDQDGSMPARYAFGNDPSNMWVRKYWKATDPAGYDETVHQGSDWCTENCHGTGMRHLSGSGDDW